MKLAILSDIHDNAAGLEQTLRDAERRNADRFISLGDVGYNLALFEHLHSQGIPCVYGNWEAGGYQRLPQSIASWVATWPTCLSLSALIAERLANESANQPSDDPAILFSHATPAMPPNVPDMAAMVKLLRSGVPWVKVFPRLHTDETAVWNALAFLEEHDIRAAFHGHTHVQMTWAWTSLPPLLNGAQTDGADFPLGKRKLRSFSGPCEFELLPGSSTDPARYIIGVGSCGEPHDGAQLRYAIYDTVSYVVSLHAIE